MTGSPRARRGRRGPGVAAPLIGCLFAAAVVAGKGAAGWPAVAGVAIVFATPRLFRRDPSLAVRLPAMLAATAAAIAIAQPWRSGGSTTAAYYLMTGCLAAGMAMRGRGAARAVWLTLAAADGFGWWSAESRGPGGDVSLWRDAGTLAAALLVVWIAAAVVRDARAIVRAPMDGRLLGLSAGVIVFAAACLLGRASLFGVAACAFWMQFALMMALAESMRLNQGVTDHRSHPFHQ